MSSGFGYFMSAAVVLAICLVTYFMVQRLVSMSFLSQWSLGSFSCCNWKLPFSKCCFLNNKSLKIGGQK